MSRLLANILYFKSIFFLEPFKLLMFHEMKFIKKDGKLV